MNQQENIQMDIWHTSNIGLICLLQLKGSHLNILKYHCTLNHDAGQ